MKQQTFVAGITAKGNGDCFLSPERHTSLSGGGGQAGQGYPCILTAGFSAGAGSSAGSIGYGEEVAPTLKGTASGNCMPSILCLNDQGGSAMACSEDVTGTLRAQEHGHQPLVFDNHGQDTRFLGPVNAAQTVSATFGMGGNNQPLVVAEREAERQHFLKTMGLTLGILVPIRSRRQCLHATVRAETMFHSWRREMTLFALPAMR